MFDNAREYLARVVPWPEPGRPGYVNLHWTFPPPNPRPDGKNAWAGRAVTSMAEATSALIFALKPGSNTQDIYACMSMQGSALPKVTRAKKFQYNAPIRLRENAVLIKSFFLDIDVKGGPNGYDTPEELFLALHKFVTDSGLPQPSMVVGTGGGYHVYWCIDQPITIEEWQPYAFALVECTKKHSLKCDSQCSVDSVRLLRVPDTYNYKSSTARLVRFIGQRTSGDYSLDRITRVLDQFKIHTSASASMVGVDLNLFPRKAPYTAPSELEANLDNLFPPIDLDRVAASCPFLANTLATGGVNNDNSLWNLTTLISTFTQGGRADAHRMGDKHATYSPKETNEQFDRKDRERAQRGIGWPSCTSIANAGAKACASCVNSTKGKSPLNFEVGSAPGSAQIAATSAIGVSSAPTQPIQTAFGAVSPQAPAAVHTHSKLNGAVVNDLPAGFIRDGNSIVCKIETDPKNSSQQIPTPISKYPVVDGWLQRVPYTLHFKSMIENNLLRPISIETEIVGGMHMRSELQKQGFMLPMGDKNFGEFLVSWISELQKVKGAIDVSPFGWQEKNGQTTGFVFGGRCWTPAGDEPAGAADPVLTRHYSPTGDEAVWLDVAKLVTSQGRFDLETIIASAFAAPLVMVTGHNGAVLSAYSKESGVGKTTASKLAQAVWGHPVKARQSLTDTFNGVMKKVGQIKSLPLYWDELKSEDDTKKFVSITFQISEGREKSRLNSSAELREPGEWQTIVVHTSNDSLVDHVSSHVKTTLAGMYRIFEFRVKGVPKTAPGQISDSDATMRLGKLNGNFGIVGMKYAKFLGENFAQVEKDMKQLQNELLQLVTGEREERLWTTMMACLVLGARYCNHIGYKVLDEAGIKGFLIDKLQEMRGHTTTNIANLSNSINPSSILAEFFREMQKANMVLTTDRINIAAGAPPAQGAPNEIKPVGNFLNLKGIVIQVGKNDKLFRISSTAFGEWCKKQGISRFHVMEALKETTTIAQVKGYLGSGVHGIGVGAPKEYLIQIDTNSNPDLNFIDGVQ